MKQKIVNYFKIPKINIITNEQTQWFFHCCVFSNVEYSGVFENFLESYIHRKCILNKKNILIIIDDEFIDFSEKLVDKDFNLNLYLDFLKSLNTTPYLKDVVTDLNTLNVVNFLTFKLKSNKYKFHTIFKPEKNNEYFLFEGWFTSLQHYINGIRCT